jgi:hypothetical protein
MWDHPLASHPRTKQVAVIPPLSLSDTKQQRYLQKEKGGRELPPSVQ